MSMNIFRFTGDMLRMLSIIILLYQVHCKKHAKSISVRFLEASVLVSLSRYLDLFTTFYSPYNSLMKIFFIFSELSIILSIKYRERINATYDKARDSFQHWRYIVAPCVIIGFLVSIRDGIERFDPMEYLWGFSIILESVSIVPQLELLKRYRQVEPLVDMSVFCRGIYRIFYILNWVYRANTERNYRHHYVVYICGVVQSALYFKFFYRLIKGGTLCKIIESCFVSTNAGGEDAESGTSGEGSGLTELLLEESNDENVDATAIDVETEAPLVTPAETNPDPEQVVSEKENLQVV